jgi:hypothetical protein
MELASMLAGERFSDHPRSVCPVIAGFLRAYNDSVGDEMRQALYEIAAKVVGSRTSSMTERARARRLGEWILQLRAAKGWRRLVRWRLPGLDDPDHPSILGRLAADAAGKPTRESQEAVFALIDELLTIGQAPPASGAPHRPAYPSSAASVQVPPKPGQATNLDRAPAPVGRSGSPLADTR